MFSHDFIWTQEFKIPKLWGNKYNYLLFHAGLFTSFMYLNTMVGLGSTFNCQLPVKNRKCFTNYTFPVSILNIAKLLGSWLLEVEIWFILETLQKKLSMILDMLYFVHLSDRYNKYYLFSSVSFHFGDVWYLEYRVRIVNFLFGRKLAVPFFFFFSFFFPKPFYRVSLLTHFSPVSHFYTPWKRQETFGFLTFSGGMEMWHWTKIKWVNPFYVMSQNGQTL